MSGFPTTAVLDTFQRANQGPPPSASWTGTGFYLFGNKLKVLSNKMSGAPNWDSDVYWNPTTFGPDSEGYFEFKDTLGSQADVYIGLRLTTPGAGTTNGYMVTWESLFSEVHVYRIDAGVRTQLGAAVSFIYGGVHFPFQVGARIIDNTIYVFNRYDARVVEGVPSLGGQYVELVAARRTDSTYTGAGYIGFGIPNVNPEESDLVGGGTVNYTIVNGTKAQLINVNAAGVDVDPMSYKEGVVMTSAEIATLLATPGVAVTAHNGTTNGLLNSSRQISNANSPASARVGRIIKYVARKSST